MRKIQVYISNQRIELFDDEQIQINSSVQNVQDISKVFTDFSQSFTIPASEINNAVFKHFYQSDVDTTLDYQVRRPAKIEIDLVTFRTGKIQLEKANLKKGMVESYTITFFGDVRTLQDYFGDDKLAVLDFGDYTHPYTGTEIQNRITSTTDYDIRYPLISSDRAWTYDDSASTDISKNSTRMSYTELSPALKIRRIFEQIEAKYNIDFVGTFLTDLRFDKAFLYLKNKETFQFETKSAEIDILTYSGYDTTGYVERDVYDLVNNTLHIEHDPEDIKPFLGYYYVWLTCTYVSDPSVTYYIDVYVNGTLDHTVSASGTGQKDILQYYNSAGLNKTFKFVVKANSTVDVQIKPMCSQYRTEWYDDGTGNLQEIVRYYIFDCTVGIMYFVADFDVNSNLPDMTVSDFVKGILKEFNLTIAPLSQARFELMPLEDWYAKGRIIDITKHTDIDSIDVERVKLYKKISFKYQKSESFMNRQYFDAFAREYGDLDQTFDYDGTDFLVESPFENLLHNKFTGTNLQVGYLLDRNFGKYIPKPVLLYMDTQRSCSFHFYNGSSVPLITSYMPFGQDTTVYGNNYSLNFGNEPSTLKDITINNGIYNTYYSNYINNLYVKKNRLIYVKCYFPLSILTSIRLNDRVIIRDKRYIINEMKSNLTTGEVDLVLLLDFRPIKTKSSPRDWIPVDGKTIKSPVILPNGVIRARLDVGTTGIVATPNEIFEDTNVEFVIPANSNPSYFITDESGDNLDTEDYFNLISEEGNPEILDVVIEYDYEDGTVEYDDYTFIIKGS